MFMQKTESVASSERPRTCEASPLHLQGFSSFTEASVRLGARTGREAGRLGGRNPNSFWICPESCPLRSSEIHLRISDLMAADDARPEGVPVSLSLLPSSNMCLDLVNSQALGGLAD